MANEPRTNQGDAKTFGSRDHPPIIKEAPKVANAQDHEFSFVGDHLQLLDATEEIAVRSPDCLPPLAYIRPRLKTRTRWCAILERICTWVIPKSRDEQVLIRTQPRRGGIGRSFHLSRRIRLGPNVVASRKPAANHLTWPSPPPPRSTPLSPHTYARTRASRRGKRGASVRARARRGRPCASCPGLRCQR